MPPTPMATAAAVTVRAASVPVKARWLASVVVVPATVAVGATVVVGARVVDTRGTEALLGVIG